MLDLGKSCVLAGLEHGSWVVGAQLEPGTQTRMLIIGCIVGELDAEMSPAGKADNEHRLMDARDSLRGAVDQGEASQVCAWPTWRGWPAPFVKCSWRGQFGTTPFTSCPQCKRYRGEEQDQDDQPFCRSIAAVRIHPEYGLYPVVPEECNDGDDPRDRAAYGFQPESTTKT